MLNNHNKMTITSLQHNQIEDIPATNEPFSIFGKVIPSLQSGRWSYKESLFENRKEIWFPDDKLDWDLYIDKDDKALFLAYLDDTCIGQIRIIRDWNRFCYIENIAVRKDFRKLGVGLHLLTRAEEWAKEHQLIGMSLEAQDDNLAACRFYAKHGFILGGVDTLKHSNNVAIEATLYWYKLFR
ncbi:GNAT family N-acetyltransferase [Paenalkalicoccus suaedae]|uniref:GNAT family N-acetyltransferase n=1 Tax=Paenalkalicoccus suaedae TaxID=2592382 RepID=A0A859FEH3_9BACI|nr:GNAT family N-acetyltransferase [Paenalkalicoccus suaedae]QKS71248.1 GNAT family N-acetyltransferase [Paenalkalicoccus suaedae]